MPATPAPPRAETVRRLARELGFALTGIAPAEPAARAGFLRDWLAAGRHGEMAYLTERLDERLDPRVLLPGAASVICVADAYPGTPDEPRSAGDLPAAAPVGRIARYARGDDYHPVMKKRLHALENALRVRWPDHGYRSAVDTAPVLEREHAWRAGLGWIGKNTLMIHPRRGSWLLLGEIVTTLRLATSADLGIGTAADHCGTCRRCLDACPTGCLTPYAIDARRCISYLTLEHRGPIDEGLHPQMGDWIAGCDVCQEVCPYNRAERAADEVDAGHTDGSMASHPAYAPRPPAPAVPLLELLGWDAEARRRAFERSTLKRIKLAQLKRNALIAAGNALVHRDEPALRTRIESLAVDPGEEELVRTTASQVLARIGGRTRSNSSSTESSAPPGLGTAS